MRRNVLKRLDDDCLLDGQLHPSIRQRLERVRDLPLTCVANLHGIERVDGVTHLVWSYVEGTPLDELHDADWARIVREVVLAVESLHAAGIVHGAIHGRNVLLDAAGNIRLTHVSPLLYNDPSHDAADAIAMLEACVLADEAESPLADVLTLAAKSEMSLADLYAMLNAQNVAQIDAPDVGKGNIRTRSIVAAVAVAACGLAVVVGIIWFIGQNSVHPYVQPAARDATP